MNQLIEFLTNHWQLASAAVIILVLIVINELFAQKKRAKDISPVKLVELINEENAVLIDLRDAETFKNGHVIGSIRVAADDFEQKRMEQYKKKLLVLICARGQTAATLAIRIKTSGFENVLVLTGGIAAWQTAGYPLVKGK